MPYLDNLNPEQKEAVTTIQGPVLVLAGAGTGKTRVLTSRIAHILSTNRAYPSQILAVTFTNKAANEMKMRVRNLIGDTAESMPWLNTFHAIGAKILHRHAELIGLNHNFSIIDTNDRLRLLKSLIIQHGIDDKRWPARQLASCLDHWKNRGLTPDKILASDSNAYANGKGQMLYTAYQKQLKTLQLVDFGDLLLLCITLFNTHHDLAEEYRKRFRFVMVDEYQDTNTAQYLWLRILTNQDGNICCVGDDDQSIYGWRGAEVDHILHFKHHFPSAKVIRLKHNYRSTTHILKTASHLIAHNKNRLEKTLLSATNEEGEKVYVSEYWNDGEEARTIGEDIKRLQRQNHDLNNIAILVRASFQMRSFEDSFIALGIDYRVIGGPRFYERAEIRDALSYLKLLISPSNDLAFERIINMPRRGIGNTTIQILRHRAMHDDTSLMQAAQRCCETEELKSRPRNSLHDLLTKFERWKNIVDTMPHSELASLVLDETGYMDMWKRDQSADAPSRLENLKELIRSMETFESLADFLEHISLVMDVDVARNGQKDDRVNIMTLHASKGLEFDTVFLPGWEEGLFPHQRALDEHGEDGNKGLEEERRLAYVGLTRARKLAKISFTQNRRVHAMWQSAVASRFIDELPADDIIVQNTPCNYGNYGNYKKNFNRDFSDNIEDPDNSDSPFSSVYRKHAGLKSSRNQNKSSVRRHQSAANNTEDNAINQVYAIGERVFHLKFGNGEIIAVDGNKLTVLFDKAGCKHIISSYIERC